MPQTATKTVKSSTASKPHVVKGLSARQILRSKGINRKEEERIRSFLRERGLLKQAS